MIVRVFAKQKAYLFILTITTLLNLPLLHSETVAEVPISGEHKSPLPVEEFQKQNPIIGSYHLVAYVTAIFTCPLCPVGALCEPCGEMIRVSDHPGKDTGALTLYTSKAAQFKLGRKYIFKIKICPAPLIEEFKEVSVAD